MREVEKQRLHDEAIAAEAAKSKKSKKGGRQAQTKGDGVDGKSDSKTAEKLEAAVAGKVASDQADIVMAYIVMAYIVMAYIFMAYIPLWPTQFWPT